MANYASLKAAIQQVVKTNGNNEITGALLQQSLLAMINALGADYLFVGIAQPSTNPGTPDQNVFYIAGPGTYPNFNGTVIADGRLGVLKYNGSWVSETVPVGTDYSAEIDELRKTVVGDFYLPTATGFNTYNTSIAELFINPYYLNGVTGIDMRYYSPNIHLKSGLWYVQNSLSGYQNGDVIPLTVTTAGGNAAVGDVVGYIVFKDIDLFRSLNTANASSNPLNILFIQRIQNAPTIAAYFQIQRQEKKRFYVTPTTVTAVPTYENCISELFILPSVVGGSVKSISVSNYSGNINVYGRATESGGTTVFRCNNSLSAYQNGNVIPLTVTTAGGEFSVGDVVGYIVFKDIDTFKATKYSGSSAFVDLSVVCDIINAPIIISYFVLPKNEEEQTIYIPNSSISAVAIYESCISELWINSNFGNIGPYAFKNYGGYSYLYYRESGNSFECITNLAGYQNGDIIPLIVTTAGGKASVGDVVGYVIFKDIETFKATSYGGTSTNIVMERAFLLENNRTIWNGIIVTPETVEQIVDEKLAADIGFLIPSTIYAAVGVELNIYNDCVALSMDKGLISPTNYIVRWSCSKGTITNRCFRYTPQSGDIGNVALTCYIYNSDGVLLQSKAITIKVVAAQISSLKRVVFFGDSTGAGSANALYNDFNDSSLFSGTKPTMLGVRGTTPKYEAFGGARWADYATEGRAAFRCQVTGVGAIALNSTYTNNGTTWTVVEVNVTDGTGNILITANELMPPTHSPQTNGTLVSTSGGANIPYTDATLEPGNPLWYNNAIDFAHYRNTLGLSTDEKLDLVSFQLGLNGSEAIETTRQYIVNLYNAAIADNPNCIVVLGLVTGPANTVDAYGANYGAGNWMDSIKRYHSRRQLYFDLAESGDYPNMRIATPNLNIDRYFGFPMGTRDVSARNTTQEQYHTNFVHPNATGYAQIGDSFFSAYIALLNS